MARRAFMPPDDKDDDVLDFLASGRPVADAPAPVALVATEPPAHVEEPRAKAARARRPAADAAKAAQLAGLKRIGLYLDVPTWAQLKKISLERAERGQAGDFTSIVLEALRAQYPDRRWDKR